MNEPHWLVQELAGEAVWTTLGLGVAYAWNKRGTIKAKLRLSDGQTLHVSGIPSEEAVGKPTLVQLSGAFGGSSSAYATLTVGSERQILWNIAAPTRPQLKRVADELLELGLWYLRQS